MPFQKTPSPLTKSSTYKEYKTPSEGTNLTCECGWKGPLRETTQCREYTREGARTADLFCCKRCLKILTGTWSDPPIPMSSQIDIAFWNHIRAKFASEKPTPYLDPEDDNQHPATYDY
jgi:hypothetical protein